MKRRKAVTDHVEVLGAKYANMIFFKANLELGKISEWFRANKLL